MVDMQEVARAVAAASAPGLRLRQGKVISVQTSTVTITIGASTVAVPGVKYLASYSPTANDVVWMLTDGATVLIIGKLA